MHILMRIYYVYARVLFKFGECTIRRRKQSNTKKNQNKNK